LPGAIRSLADILGSYFPHGCFALAGILLAVIAHKILVKTGVDELFRQIAGLSRLRYR